MVTPAAPPSVSLGFARETFPAGVHVCQIFSDDCEREDSLLGFLRSGLEAGERCCCFSDNISAERIAEFLDRHGISSAAAPAAGGLSTHGARATYFDHGHFEPERMLARLLAYHTESVQQGWPAARLIGEMSPEIERMPGGERLVEYEARVSLLLRQHPVTTVCQYDARTFGGATIMDVLRVHPFMVIRGQIVQNPFFVPPEECLGP